MAIPIRAQDRAFYRKLEAKKLIDHERLSERSAVMYNAALSPQARVLYYLIDDLAGSGTGMWWGWRKMALRLGLSRTRFFMHVAELREAGVLTVERRGRRIVYLPGKVPDVGPVDSERSRIRESQVPETGMSADLSLYESVQFESGAEDAPVYACHHCRDTGISIIGGRGPCRCTKGYIPRYGR